jgi:enoyl-CoA hydratase
MSYQTIIYEVEEDVGVVRLNRPARMNAVIEEMYVELRDALARAAGADALRALVLTGTVRVKDGVSKPVFCAGADLKKHGEGDRSHGAKRAYIELAHATALELHELPCPTIAAINGAARGAGVEMALGCDFVLTAEQATLAFTETGLGTFVGGGVTRLLPQLVGLARAKELIYTGRVIDGREAVELGLALACHPVERLHEAALALARQIAERAPISIALAKRRLQQSASLDLETVLALETDAILSCMDTEDWAEGTRSFNEKRKPLFKGK